MGKIYRVIICGMKTVGKTLILEQIIYGSHKHNSVSIAYICNNIYYQFCYRNILIFDHVN